MMKGVVLSGIRQFQSTQLSEPRIVNDTDVLIRVRCIGVCGSDIHYYTTGRIGSQIVRFPFLVGHEAAGTVEEIGRMVSRVRVGENIAIDPAVSCGQCDQCKAGREHTCRHLLFLGSPGQLAGSLCERLVLPERCCYPVEPAMSYEQAALSEPLAIAVYAVKRSGIQTRGTAAILGVGPIGMSVFHVLRATSDVEVYVTDKIDDRLAFARSLTPRWSGNATTVDVVKEIGAIEPLQLDTVFECSGDEAAILQGIRLLKPGGCLVIVGIPEVDEVGFPMHELRRKEITIINVRRQVRCTQKAIDLLCQRKVHMDAMVTHRFPLDRTQQAFDLVAGYRDGVMKAMITID
jgi:L-iditol 2-dehydrogenase